MFDLTPQELMLLIQVASKAAEFERYMFSGLLQDKRDFEATQWRAAIGQVIPVLRELDRQQPGFVPVPHDGVPWKDRV
jgi:hypothetical protein